MTPYFQDDSVTIYHGDCRDILPQLPKVDLVLTDPPYELGFMGKDWDKQGVSFQPETWRIIKDSCKPGAMMLSFGGTRTWHRIAVAIEDAGWEIRDTLMWLYGQGFPKSLNISKQLDGVIGKQGKGFVTAGDDGRKAEFKQTLSFRSDYGYIYKPQTPEAQLWSGYGTALKPAFEPIILAMKPLDGTFAQNALKHGVAGLNIDGSRIGTNAGWKYPNGRGGSEPHHMERGERNGIADLPSVSTKGRFPANVILDEEAGWMLDQMSGTSTSSGGKSGHTGAYGGGYKEEYYGNQKPGLGDSGGASRFFYCAKASKSERDNGNNHPTVKPLALMKYLCNLLKIPIGGVLLDPFMGSGSTLLACQELGIKAIGIELDEHVCEIAAKRMSQTVMALA